MRDAGISAQLMYPGDANNDGMANYLDLLPIGIAFGVEGEPRPGASENWFAQPFFLWPYELPTTFVNGGYIDANGDALIDTLDLNAIVANYDLMQDTAGPMPWLHEFPCFTCPPPIIQISYDQDSVQVNEPFQVFLNVIYPEPLPEELAALGLAMEMSFDPDLIVESSVEVMPNTDSGTLMFVTATSQAAFGYRLPAPGRIHFAAAGRGQNAINQSFNPIATVSLIVVDDIQRDTAFRVFKMEIENLLMLNLKEELIFPIVENPDSVILYQPLNAVKEAGSELQIQIHPNPAHHLIRISASQKIDVEVLHLFDLQGQLVREWRPGEGHSWEVPVSGLPAGMYWLEMIGKNARWVKKVVVN